MQLAYVVFGFIPCSDVCASFFRGFGVLFKTSGRIVFMASSSSGDPTFALVFLFALGLVLFAFGFSRLKLKQRIENTPTSKVRSIAMGSVEVAGKVVASDEGLLEAPFTGTPCVYYRYAVEVYRSEGKKKGWHTVDSGLQAKRFLVQDDTGRVLVDPKFAEVDIPHDFLQVGFQDPPERVRAFLTAKSVSHQGLFGWNKKMRYSEWHVAPDDDLFVTGEAGDNPFVAEGTVVEGHKDVMISKGASGPFYISDKSEKKIVGELNWQGWGGVLAGLASGVAGLAWLLAFWKVF